MTDRAPAAVSVKDTTAELGWISDRLSASVRLVAAAVLAIAWGLLVSPPATLTVRAPWLLSAMLIALLTLTVDLAQYVVGYLNTDRHHHLLIDGDEEAARGFDETHPLYQWRVRFFWAKQVLVGVAFAVLLAAVFPPIAARL